MTKFVVFTTPRTGSSLLVKTLDSHPEIFCAGELFFLKGNIYHNETRYQFWKFPVGSKLNYIINCVKLFFTLTDFLNKFYKTDHASIKAKGFKLMLFQTFYIPGIFRYLKKHDVKVIVLIRKNTFREALSSFRARKIGVFHSADDASLAEQKINVNAALLKKRVEQLEAINENILRLSEGKDRIIITYEEFGNWQQMLDKVFDFLNIEQLEMQPELRKISAENWRNGVENYQQVEDTMKEKYAHFLN